MEQKYEYTPLYYGTPCQVKFYNTSINDYCGGIAYHDIIVSGLDGSILLIEDIVKQAAQYNIHWDDAVIELEWINISDIIKG